MTTVIQQSVYAQTASAAYATNLAPGTSQANVARYVDASMSTSQAQQFDATWNVLSQSTPSLTGFSAVLLQNRATGEKVFAIAGTDPLSPADLLTDIVNIMSAGSIVLMPQYISLLQFYQQLMTDGLLTPAEGFTVTGHSLGGFLAQAFAVNHSNVVTSAYTYNAPGFVGAMGQLLDFLGAPGSLPGSTITNVRAADGLSATAGLGILVGTTIDVRIEGSAVPVANHSIVRLSDALAVQAVLSQLDPGLTQGRLDELMRAAAQTQDRTLESLVDDLRTTLLGPVTPTAEGDRDALYANLAALTDSNAFQALAGSLHVGSASSLSASEAATKFSVLMALHDARMVVLQGNDATSQTLLDATMEGVYADLYALWQADMTLSAEERAASRANFSDRWLSDRLAYVQVLAEANRRDAVLAGPADAVLIDQQSGNVFSTAPWPHADTLDRIVFGRSGVDDTITGGEGNDRIYGGHGNGSDVLDGGEGNDYLEGGGGDDWLVAGSGRDTLNGGAGSDTYEINQGVRSVNIRDSDGAGFIVVEREDSSAYTLGSSDIWEIAGSPGHYEDDEGNRYQRNGSDLIVLLEDGRRLTIENFQSMSGTRLGLTLQEAETYVPPSGASTYTVANPGATVPQQTEADINANGRYGSTGNFREWETAGYWFNRRETEIVYASEATEPVYDTPFARVAGGFGDSHIYGDSGFNWIIDDGAMLQATGQGGPLGQYNLAHEVGNDRIEAGDGNDWILTRGGNDVVYAGEGDDVIDQTVSGWEQLIDQAVLHQRGSVTWLATPGRSSNDRFFGEAGNDYINADGGNQFMDGGADDDELYAGAGDDVLIGGDGNDVLGGDLYLQSAPFLATYDAGGYVTNMVFDGNALAGDVVNYGNDILDGGDGDDTLFGGGGDDLLIGGTGNDRLQGDFTNGYADLRPGLRNLLAEPLSIHGNDTIYGGDGDDLIDGGGGDDVLYGEAGNDTIHAGAGDDFVDGGTGADLITGDYSNLAQGNDEIHGGAGNDTIWGMGGNDRLFGDAGDDYLYGGNGTGSQSGDDYLEGGDGDDRLFGEDGNDTLHGGLGSDVLQGGAGDDTLIGSPGNDALYGEAGNDKYALNLGTGPIQITDTAGQNSIVFGAGVRREDVQVRMSGSTVRIYFSATDHAYMSVDTFNALVAAEFEDGPALDHQALRHTFQPGSMGLDQSIWLASGVASNEVGLRRRNDDLLLTYSGAVGNWVDTSTFAARNVLFERGDGSSFGLPSGTQVLVLTNWYRQSSQYLTTLAPAAEPPVNFVASAYTAPGAFVGTTQSDILTGTSVADVLSGEGGADLLEGGGGSDDLRGGPGADYVSGGAGDDVYRIGVGDGMDIIYDESGSGDVLRFDPGILPDDIVLTDSPDSLTVRIGSAANGDRVEILIRSATGGQTQPIERFEFDDGTVWNSAQIQDRISGNRRPVLQSPLQDQDIGRGHVLSYTIPVDAFVDPESGPLIYQASLAGGGNLPLWLTFDPVTRTISGSTSQADAATLAVQITVRDAAGLGARSVFTLRYDPGLIVGSPADDVLIGAEGNDRIMGGDGSDHIEGRAGDDELHGGAGNDRILAGRGEDQIFGGAGDDELDGGEGNDIYYFSSGFGRDTVRDGYGLDDRVEFMPDSGIRLSSLTVTRTDYDLVIAAGSDQLTIENWYRSATRPIERFTMYLDGLPYVYSAEQIELLVTGANSDPATLLASPELVVGTGETVAYTLPVNAFVDTQSDTGEDDLVYSVYTDAGQPPSWLTFDPVSRTLNGTVPGNASGDATIGLQATDASGSSTVQWINFRIYAGLNRVVGTDAGEVLNGSGGADQILGGAGDDVIAVGGGRNYADGGDGNDSITGSSDNDRLYGGDGDDVISGLGGEDIIDGGRGNDHLLGGSVWDRIYGGSGKDYIEGRGGGDRLYGGGGNDHILGGAGEDSIYGDDDDDVLDGGGDHDVIFGGAGDDVLIGGGSFDYLWGGLGNDRIHGGEGGDSMGGNEGNDLYYGIGPGSDYDRIDEVAGYDTVEFSSDVDIRVTDLYIDRSGSHLVINGEGFGVTVYMAFSSGIDRRIENFVLYDGGLKYSYSAEQIEACANGLDAGPAVNLTFDPRSIVPGQVFSYTIPLNAFTDAESQFALAYSVAQAGNGSLPSWLNFDPATRMLSGNPSANDAGVVGLRITATDESQQSASSMLWINVDDVRIEGGNGDDTVAGSAGGDALYGHDGDDVLLGQAGNDLLTGGSGDDVLDGEEGADWMYGGAGNDTYFVDSPDDFVKEDAAGGIDLIIARSDFRLGEHIENLTLVGQAVVGAGNELDNRLIGNSENNVLYGYGGDDFIEGGGGIDQMVGGHGDDTYLVDDPSDAVVELLNGGIDTVFSSVNFVLPAYVEHLTLQGTVSINATGNNEQNVLIGNAGANVLNGLGNADSMIGRAGDDTYIVDVDGDEVIEFESEGTDLVQSSVFYTLPDHVENLTLTGFSAIDGVGNASNNILTGNSRDNILRGEEGDDTLNGGSGNDTMYGGRGDDVYVVAQVGDVVIEYAGEGVDLVQSSIAYTLGNHVEHLTLTGFSGISGTGNDLDNILTGNGGSNTLSGGSGNDTLDGGAGSDTMLGGLGDDIYVVAQTSDIVTENANEGTDLVRSSVTYTLAANVENLTLTGSSAINGTGNALDNILTGNSGNNTLTGGAGNDTLDPGSAGTDTLRGGQGDDIYIVGRSSGITITENANEGTDTVRASVTYTLGNNVENLLLTGSGNVNGTGNTLNNILTGNDGNNTLTGGAGNDTLIGGNGADIYSYSSGHGADVIDNYSTDSALDRLNFTNLTNSQVTFSRSGDDLLMTRNGSATDSVRVTNWFADSANQLDFVQFTNQTLTAAQVNDLLGFSGFSAGLIQPLSGGDSKSLGQAMQNTGSVTKNIDLLFPTGPNVSGAVPYPGNDHQFLPTDVGFAETPFGHLSMQRETGVRVAGDLWSRVNTRLLQHLNRSERLVGVDTSDGSQLMWHGFEGTLGVDSTRYSESGFRATHAFRPRTGLQGLEMR